MNMHTPVRGELVQHFEELIRMNLPPVMGIDVKVSELVPEVTEALYSHLEDINYNLQGQSDSLREILVFPAGYGDLSSKLRTSRRDGVGIIVVYSSQVSGDKGLADLEALGELGIVNEW